MENSSVSQEKPYIYAFSLFPFIGPAKFRRIKNYFSSFKKAWLANEKQLLKAGLNEKIVRSIVQNRIKIDPLKEWASFQMSDFQLISEDCSAYPQQLKEIKSSPFLLFSWGDVSLLKKKQLAVVGTRRFSPYGQLITEKLVAEISQSGLVITSGLAQGIDSFAHQTALASNCPTLAVLGNGFNETLNRGISKQLADQIIAQGGLIISEYPPNFKATRFTFPARNRIISGLSLGTLVIEAGESSGALITARYALEQNREVFSIPGNILSAQSVGTHQLLKEGAQLVTSANDVLEAFNFSSVQTSLIDEKHSFENKTEAKIYQQLSLEPLHIDKIAKKCQLNSALVSAKLSLLELQGLARNIGGGMFIKS